MAGKKRGCLHWLWVLSCSAAGAAIGATLLGLQFNSWPLAAVGGVIGAVLGFAFGKFISFGDFLMHSAD